MLPNRWYAIYESKKLGEKKPLNIQRLNQELVLWRDHNKVARIAIDRCPHRGTKISAGTLTDGCLTCPYHGFQFQGDGTCVHIPAAPTAQIPSKMTLSALPSTEKHGLIWLWHGPNKPTENVPWLDHAPSENSATSVTAELVYPIHYTRMVEANFDLHHFPFVHGNLAGKLSPVTTGIKVEHGDDWITSTAYLGEESAKNRFKFQSDLRLPNVQVLRINKRFEIVTVASPIDERSTWTWARLEIVKPRVPLVGKLLAWAALKTEFGYIQYKQDIPVLEPMTPSSAQPGSSVFVAADAAAARYVNLRKTILDRSGTPPERFKPQEPHPSATTSLL